MVGLSGHHGVEWLLCGFPKWVAHWVGGLLLGTETGCGGGNAQLLRDGFTVGGGCATLCKSLSPVEIDNTTIP